MNSFMCDKCGLCCQNIGGIASELDNGKGVCKFYDFQTKLCKIYDTRPDICNVEKGYVFFKDVMSYEEYIDLNYKLCKELKRRSL
ncbi:MAG: YkgJ family cysteine cluster protein [Eubacterium sp.]|nr:YkgJ family cysteine cluster protein [Eubacterium sp.]